MDIEKNPGPLRTTNQDYSASNQNHNAFIIGHRLSQDRLASTTYLYHHFSSRRFIYSRADLFKIRFESSDVRLGIEQLSQLKRSSLLRYRGKRSGKVKDYHSCLNSSIAVLSCRRYITSSRPITQEARTLILVPPITDVRPPVRLSICDHAAFSLLNVQSVKNKRV